MPCPPAGPVCLTPPTGAQRHALHGSGVPRPRRYRAAPRGQCIPYSSAARVAATDGAQLAPDASLWRWSVFDQAQLENVRCDFRRSLGTVCAVLYRTHKAGSMSSAPTIARIQEATGLSRATVYRVLQWLRTRDFLVVYETGSTAQYRPAALAEQDSKNRASVYLLTLPADCTPQPPVERSETPRPLPVEEDKEPPHARGDIELPPLRGRAVQPRPTLWRRSWERTWAAEQVQLGSLPLRRLSTRHVASLVRAFIAAGWTARDVLWALAHTPDGTEHRHHHDVRSPAGWARRRLEHWRDNAGAPIASHTTRLIQAAATHREAAEQRRLAMERAAAAATAPTEKFRAALASLPRTAASARRLRRRSGSTQLAAGPSTLSPVT